MCTTTLMEISRSSVFFIYTRKNSAVPIQLLHKLPSRKERLLLVRHRYETIDFNRMSTSQIRFFSTLGRKSQHLC